MLSIVSVVDMQLIPTKQCFGQYMMKFWRQHVTIVRYYTTLLMYMHSMTAEPVTKLEEPKANKKCADLKEFYEYQQALANWSVDDGRINYDNCHLYLWKAMSQFPIMAEARSRVIVPRALHFIKSVIPHTLHVY